MININSYMDTLFNNQNVGADDTQKNLCNKSKYLRLLKNVLEVLNNYKDLSLEELRNKLYEKSNLENLLIDFFCERKLAPGAVISYGTKNYEEVITIGNKQEVVMENGNLITKEEKMESNTIFDLASTTKMFTAICILKLVDMNMLNLNDELVKYVPRFNNLKGITILDLLTFEPLEVPRKIDSTEDLEEALGILFQARRMDLPKGSYKYNDIAPMTLKYVIEKVSGIKYYDFLKQVVLDKLNMNNTFVSIPSDKINMVANCNYDGRIYESGDYIIRTKANKGIATDNKARILGQPEGNLSGHAGLFSDSSDITKLSRGLIDNRILNFKTRDEMAKNRRGYNILKPDGKKNYGQYFGMLVYSKNPDIYSSEVYYALSGKSFAAAGWTGTQVTIDPINNLHFSLLSNRCHNRITSIAKNQEWKIIQNDVLGYKSVLLRNEYEMIDASHYAYERDEIINKTLELALEYKILEDITGYSKNNDKIEKRYKKIL